MAGQGDTFRALPRSARAYLAGVQLAAFGAVAATADAGPSPDWALIALVTAFCAAGKALEAFAPGHYALQPGYAALVWGCLLAPPWAAPIFALALFADELRPGGALYKGLFNVANYTLVGVAVAVVGGSGGVLAMAAAAVFAALANHALIVAAIALAGEQPLRATVLQIADGLPLSVAVGLTGCVLAQLWSLDPALILLALGPVGLMVRALWVPMLRHRADTDPKTGLFHSERIREELAAQVAAGGPLAVAMLDLDHLREINTRCGHLAGDRAICAVADELAVLAATHGAAGRFGGEEFCVVLPGFDAGMAQVQLEAILRRLEGVEFRDSPDVRVSFSAGVAVLGVHGTDVDDLLRAADTALYGAKSAGRARVHVARGPAVSTAPPSATAPVRAGMPEQPLPAANAGGHPFVATVTGLRGRRRGDVAKAAGAKERARS